MFGSSSTFGNSTFGGFGSNNNNNNSGGLFGSKNAFGNTATSTFGSSTSTGFGNTTSGGLFGAKPNNTGNSLFGSNNTGSTFGSSTFGGTPSQTNTGFGGSSIFGNIASTASTGGLFGSTSNTFGSNTTSAFGSSNTNTGSSIFGGSGSTFGSTQQNGTNIKYNPLISQDTQQIKGQHQTVQVKLQVITGMKEYEAKSVEELRCEDYIAGRKSGATSGAANSGSLFGAAASTASTTNTFGGFGSNTNTNNTSGGLFGSTNNTSTSLFGNNNNNNKPGGLFGSSNTGATSLFGNTNTNTGNTFGSTNTFGSSSNTSTFGNTGTSLFGNSNNNKPGGLFGSTATSSSGGGLFGGSSTNTFGNTSNTGTSLFGSTNTNTGGGGLFGNTNTNTNTSGSLFGNTANKPTFSAFGNTNTNTGTSAFGSSGTSLFGNNNNNNNKPTFNLGSNTGGTSLFGNNNTTTNTFGATNTGGSLFGNTSTNKPGGLFGTSTFGTSNNTGSSLFGNTNNNSLLGANNQQPVLGASLDSTHIHQVVAALSSAPFGDSPLFRTALDEHKKLKPSTPPPASLGNNKSRINTKLSTVRPRPLNGGYNQLFEGLEDDISPSPEAFLPRSSLKKLVLQSNRYSEPDTPDPVETVSKSEQLNIEESSQPEEVIDTTMNTIVSNGIRDQLDIRANLDTMPIKDISPIRKLPFDDTHTELAADDVNTSAGDTSMLALKTEKSSPAREEKVADITITEDDTTADNDEPILGLDGKPLKPPPPTLPFTLDRPEYYTVPGPAELVNMVKDESLVVHDLVVGRIGYGEVKFLGEVDLWGMDLDKTIFFRRKEISVYPDDKSKPPQGQALNRRSEVTLECVYPIDKGSRENITDPKEIIRRGFPGYLEKKTFKMGAKFMEYKPETGQWTFMVKHFSQYGLLDDSEDEDEEERKEAAKKLKEEPLSAENSFEDDGKEDIHLFSDDDNVSEGEGYDTPHEVTFQPRPLPKEYEGYKAGLFGFNESEEEGDEYNEEEDEGEMFVQGSHFNYSSSISLSKKGSLAKTALKMEKLEMNDSKSPQVLKASLLKEKMVPKPSNEASPKFGVSVVPSVLCLPPLSKSIANERTHLKMDEGLTRHFAYRANWTSGNKLLIKSDQAPGKSTVGRNLFDSSRTVSTTGGTGLEVTFISCCSTPEYHRDLLEVQLEHTTFDEVDGVVIAVPNRGSECLEELLAKLAEREDVTVLGPALQLIKALWADEQMKEGAYAAEQFRKSRLSDWLGDQLKVLAQKLTIEHSKLGVCHLPAVIGWLCAGGIQEACQLLCKAGDFQLALLVSQSSTPIIRQLVLKQLHEWRDSGYDALISEDRLKIYVLLSGEQIWESSTRTINVCDGLDWLSSFALYLRFLPPSAPLDQAVAVFQEAFESGHVTPPVVDDDSNLSVFWQILMLYCNPAYPLADVLNNQGITANMLDERDVWFIWTTLTSLGLPRATPHLASKLVTSYVAQLDRIGLWDWGIFVAQHLPAGRTVTIRNLIKRNIVRNITDVTALSDEEKRCLQDYHVDGNVFHCARALHARFSRDWSKVVTWYTAAEMFDSAHRILIDKIAPQKIVSREEEDLLPLLAALHEHRHQIRNWKKEGAIYFSYLHLPAVLPEGEEELEGVRHKISTTGHLLNELPYSSLTEITAVNMMGLRTCTLLVEVWRALFGETENRELLLTMKTFPLPSDYWINDIITKLSSEIVSEEQLDSMVH